MKQPLSLLVWSCLVGIALGQLTFPVEAEDTTFHRNLVALHTTVPLVIDGIRDDWPATAQLAAMALDSDSDQFSGAARVCWDETYLYLFFEVATGSPMRNAGGDASMAYKTGDTVEAFLSVNPAPLSARVARGPGMDTAKDGDYRVLMTLLKSKTPVVFGYDFINSTNHNHPMIVQVSGPLASIDAVGVIPDAQFAVTSAKVKNMDGYATEARIPWNYFRGYKPKAGDRILFNLAINFATAGGDRNLGKCYWNGPGIITTDAGVEGQVHPENWGWLVLK